MKWTEFLDGLPIAVSRFTQGFGFAIAAVISVFVAWGQVI